MAFPIARRVLKFAGKARANWLLRHQNAFNFWIHMPGIGLAFAGLLGFFVAPWEWCVGAIIVGYLLQWIGHRVEGNDVGELIPFKKMLGMKTVSIAPQFASGLGSRVSGLGLENAAHATVETRNPKPETR